MLSGRAGSLTSHARTPRPTTTPHDHAPRPHPTTHEHEHEHEHASDVLGLVRVSGYTIRMKVVRGSGHGHSDNEPASEIGPQARGREVSGRFPHEKLDAYRVGLEMARGAKILAKQIPRGHRSIADHLLRASSNAVLLLAEGANRRGSAEKRQRFVESRGESGEVAAACDLVMALDLGSEADAAAVKNYAARLGAMLTRLIQRLS